ncbi:Hypothetical predicted protein [Pelobates cultripes]|uniref:Endonuclease/exonuclease/phosphatase domain-containing protein n=1 Tax=Pelobates cultripes TaxID=61616 RepID=A0AAD1VKH2_PELCU|nr:Hypothetical predicted protein [Pelobates cultripes]
MILVTDDILPRTTNSEIGDIVWSDHVPVSVRLQAKFDHKGKPPWRLNDALTMHKDFRTQLSHDIREYFHNNTLPELEPTTTWQAHKAVVRGIFISRAAY